MSKLPPKNTVDHDLWLQHRQGITPLKEKYRHVVFPQQDVHIKPHRIKEKNYNRYREDILSSLDAPIPSQQHKSIRAGKVTIEARLDLHGLTQAEAKITLGKFIIHSHQRHYQWVLIITGKGDPQNPTSLRKLTPLWLDNIPLVSGYASAKQKDGGTGAYYVRLKTHPIYSK